MQRLCVIGWVSADRKRPSKIETERYDTYFFPPSRSPGPGPLGGDRGRGPWIRVPSLHLRNASETRDRHWTHPVPSPSALVFCHAAALKPWVLLPAARYSLLDCLRPQMKSKPDPFLFVRIAPFWVVLLHRGKPLSGTNEA